jgi:hypothetical protein
MTDDEAKDFPWNRKEDESNRWFQRFEAYRLMGPTRSMLAVYLSEWRKKRERAGISGESPKPTKVPSSWSKAARLHHWAERAEAWDKHLSDQAAAEIEAAWRAEIMSAVEVLGRLSKMARININDFIKLGANGQLTGFNREALEKNGYLVKKITTSEGKTNSIGIEMYDAQNALQLIGRHLRLFVDRAEVTGAGGGPLEVSGLPEIAALNDEELDQTIRNLIIAARVADGSQTEQE